MKKHLLMKTMLLLCALIAGSGNAWAEQTETYTFKSKSWEANLYDGTTTTLNTNWTSGQDGNELTSGRGVQVTSGKSGANATSPKSFTNISKIVVVYSTNASKGKGKIKIQVGSNTEKEITVTPIGTSDTNADFSYSTSETGAVKITVICTENSIYIKSVAITYNPTVAISSITMDASASIGVGGTVTLTPTITPSNTTETVVWESDDEDVATVSNGVVTGVGIGSTTIRAKSPSNASIKAECTVTVNAAVAVDNVSVAPTSSTLLVGGTQQLSATVSPDNATNKTVTWESSDDDIATVDENGLVTAIGVGEATITVTSVADDTKTATCAVTVNPVPVSSVSIASTAKVKIGKTISLVATVIPDNATNKAVTWESDKTNIATVNSEGVVTGVAVGEATITVKSVADNTKTSSCTVTVIDLGDGTIAKPFDIADAVATIDEGTNLTGKYVKGIVSQIDAIDTGTGLATYWISDDGTTDNQFEVYQGYYLGYYYFSSENTIAVGDHVVIYGNLKKYGSTYEFDKNNCLVELNGEKSPVLTITEPVNGAVSVMDGEYTVDSGDFIIHNSPLALTATPNAGYSFGGWSATAGSFANSSSASTTFTMPNEPATITATFTANTHELVLTSEHGTVAVTVNGETWNGTDEIPYGSTVSMTATAAVDYLFTNWDTTLGSYDATTNPLVFTMPDDDVAVEAKYLDTTIEYDVTVIDATGGTITADKDKARLGATVTISYALDTDYAFDAWAVENEDYNAITVNYDEENNRYTFTMPAKDVIVSATYKKIHEVLYSVHGVENTVNRVDGEELNLDTPGTYCGMSFAGWSDTDNVSAPNFVANSTAVTEDMILYAVYIKQAGTASYNLVEADQTDWRGDYLIAYSSTIFADGRTGGESGMGKKDTNANPLSNLSGKVVNASWGDTYNVTLEAINDEDLSEGYVLKTKDGMYNYRTASGTGGKLSATANKSTAANYPISLTFTSSENIKIASGSTGTSIRYNTDGYFRFYSNNSQSAVYLYKKVTSTPIYSLGTESIAISSAKYATYCSEQALDFSSTDVKAYTASADGTQVTLARIADGIVPANTGVVLYCATAGTYAIPVTTTEKTIEGNELVGITERTLVAYAGEGTKKNFILANEDDGVGFYKATADGAYLPANRAYLSTTGVPSESRFMGFAFGEEASSIFGITTNGLRLPSGAYDLQGRRVDSSKFTVHGSQLKKGMYIVNGKKVFVK